jgi:hypothetical protein
MNTKREEDNGWRKGSKETDMIDKITFENLDGVSELLLAFQLFDSGDGMHVRFFYTYGQLVFYDDIGFGRTATKEEIDLASINL